MQSSGQCAAAISLALPLGFTWPATVEVKQRHRQMLTIETKAIPWRATQSGVKTEIAGGVSGPFNQKFDFDL